MTERTQAPISLVIADRSPLIRDALVRLFGADRRFKVQAVASDGRRFLEVARSLRFDVGIVGWVLPDGDCGEVLRALQDVPDAPRVVVFTSRPPEELARRVMELGGAGFCSKTEPIAHLVQAVHMVAGGRMVFPIMDMRRQPADPMGDLTPRERELLEALGAGQTNAQLGRELGISLNTVKFHLKNLYDKLGVHNRAEAVSRLAALTRHAYPYG